MHITVYLLVGEELSIRCACLEVTARFEFANAVNCVRTVLNVHQQKCKSTLSEGVHTWIDPQERLGALRARLEVQERPEGGACMRWRQGSRKRLLLPIQ